MSGGRASARALKREMLATLDAAKRWAESPAGKAERIGREAQRAAEEEAQRAYQDDRRELGEAMGWRGWRRDSWGVYGFPPGVRMPNILVGDATDRMGEEQWPDPVLTAWGPEVVLDWLASEGWVVHVCTTVMWTAVVLEPMCPAPAVSAVGVGGVVGVFLQAYLWPDTPRPVVVRRLAPTEPDDADWWERDAGTLWYRRALQSACIRNRRRALMDAALVLVRRPGLLWDWGNQCWTVRP